MNPSLPFRRQARRSIACAALAASALAGFSQSAPDTLLEPYVIVATRTPEYVQTLGTAAEALSADDLLRGQWASPAEALGSLAGVASVPNGPAGSDISIFIRGANSDQVLFLVDGIRLNDANTDYSAFLGGAQLGATDSLEIARGPQSTLYGSDAVGGVVSIQSQKGSGDPSAEATLGGGSFGSAKAEIESQGARGTWAWSATLSGEHSDNQRSNNAVGDENLVLRLDRDLSPAISIGATLRGLEDRYGDPGDIYTNDPYAYETESNWLGTLFADARPSASWTVHTVAGFQDRRYVSFDEDPGVFSETTLVRNERSILDSQATYSGAAGQRITFGATGESESTMDNGYGSIDRRQTLLAAFAEDEWNPLPELFITAGLRYDDFDTFGAKETGRATVAWLGPSKSVKLRASFGTGFNAPSFLELYGVSTGYVGNPSLRPESSRGGDAGVDFYLPHGRGVLSATWFRTDTTNLIVYDFSVNPGTTANVDKARSDGLELESRFRLLPGLELRASYTYLEADDLTDGTRLLRRPRNSGSAEIWSDLGRGWSVGAGVAVVAGRQDVDAQTYLTVNDPDYTVVRAHAAWKASDRLTLRARAENLLGEKYQPVNGYPALGFGLFGEATWKL
jgi:vitamin B12 transporter